MAYPSKATVNSIEDAPGNEDGTPTKSSKTKPGPPPASPRPKATADTSLFSTAGKSAMNEGKSGLGSEGSDPNIIGTQGMTLVQRGIQLLNLAFPDNPGLTAVLADLTGRLQTLIPQLVAGSVNAGMGLFPGGGAPPGASPQPAGIPQSGPMGPPPGMPMQGQLPTPPMQ